MKKIINLIIVLMIFVLTACSNTNGNYYLIKDYSTIGIIQNYDKNDENDRLKEKMLKKQLPKMECDVAFADIEILGEENGKTYVLAFYRGYNCYGEKVKCVFSNEELAEFNDIEDDDYNSIDGQNLYLEINNFLPEKIIEEHNNSKNFDWYVYSVGEKDKELKKEEEKKIAEIKAKIKDTGDLVAFMYDHCVACAEEYTDWTARRAVKEIAKEMLGLDLD